MYSASLAILYLSILLFKSVSAERYKRNFKPVTGNVNLKDVAILQPILSGDPSLNRTLEANLHNFPESKFYWLIDNEDAVAHDIVDELILRFANVNIVKRSYEEAPEKINPKLFKLNHALQECMSDYCVVLDDDTILSRQSLEVLVGELCNAEISTGLPQYDNGTNFSSALLACFVNNNATLTYLSTLNLMDPITLNGMCYAFHRKTFEKLGGFRPVLDHLTDDLAVAQHVIGKGGKIRQTPFVQIVQTHLSGTGAYFRQMHRWNVFASLLLKKQPTRMQAVILALNGIPPLLLIAALILTGVFPSWPTIASLAVVLLVRHILIARYSGQAGVFSPSFFFTSLLSECLQPVHYVHALLCKKIKWRSRTYRVYDSNHFRSS